MVSDTIKNEGAIESQARALRERFDLLLAAGARERYWLQCEQIDRLLQRADAETPGVATHLCRTVEAQLEALGQRVEQGVERKAQPRLLSTHSLVALISDAQPEAPSYSESSRGAAFDEFLQQQENNILQTMVGSDLDEPPSALAPALTRANRYLRHRQLQHSAARLVDVAIENGPDNPGPLNPEMLSIKSLKLMRDLSPQYLNRFVAFIDSLLWIEESVASSGTMKNQAKDKAKTAAKKK